MRSDIIGMYFAQNRDRFLRAENRFTGDRAGTT